MASKEWTDDKTFSFRKVLLRIELGENVNVNETIVYAKFYSLKLLH